MGVEQKYQRQQNVIKKNLKWAVLTVEEMLEEK